METLGLGLGFGLLSALIYTYYLCIRSIYRKNGGVGRQPPISVKEEAGAAALLVTAHPDDECMFFAPALLWLTGRRLSVHLLCLSTELFQTIQNCSGTQSSLQSLSSDMYRYITSECFFLSLSTDGDGGTQDIDCQVLTFDRDGVSGHANHIAVYYAVRKLYSKKKLPNECQILVLQSVNILRKYISILDLPISWMKPHHVMYVLDSWGYQQAKNAMYCHQSQLQWFRHLYLYFSRYMFINTFHLMSR
ncbi:N-acetylglucosaminyl-phosphatidylinositol de-N-acetylase isoform X2 [Stegostoma tigrinum]|uniref:N-acetylglucosaminyl-phosphatidylinositol de-N-acetylase isoform X2 n=1 Tax=Stegostoma tigrinum TaxID=3053191 RepID=UPI00202B1325|nr:N-acetylglucosaminyl-phosphatidylinositol de-N-acetylase isoform X2 [Stegostoma tigrinum]